MGELLQSMKFVVLNLIRNENIVKCWECFEGTCVALQTVCSFKNLQPHHKMLGMHIKIILT